MAAFSSLVPSTPTAAIAMDPNGKAFVLLAAFTLHCMLMSAHVLTTTTTDELSAFLRREDPRDKDSLSGSEVMDEEIPADDDLVRQQKS